MGDRTYHSLVIADCPKDQARAVLDILNEYGYSTQADVDIDTTLALDELYFIEETNLGTSDEVAGQLMERAPGASFRASEDPKYEWLGVVSWYVPGLGLFSNTGDAQGQPVWNASEILSLLNDRGVALDDVLHRKFGITHDGALSGLADRNKGKTITVNPEED